MWTEFEWENRVDVSTYMPCACLPLSFFRSLLTRAASFTLNSTLQAYLKHIMNSTNMACLTPEGAMSGACDFLSANLYARSLFGEDALANLSIEVDGEDGLIKGHVRIRSKTQGIALSLGDRITLGEWIRSDKCHDRGC